jgi:hypothetical protein
MPVLSRNEDGNGRTPMGCENWSWGWSRQPLQFTPKLTWAMLTTAAIRARHSVLNALRFTCTVHRSMRSTSIALDVVAHAHLGSIRPFSVANDESAPSSSLSRSAAANRVKMWESIAATHRHSQSSGVQPTVFTVKFRGNTLAVDQSWTPAKLVTGGASDPVLSIVYHGFFRNLRASR